MMRTPRTLAQLFAQWAVDRAERDAVDARYAADRAAEAALALEAAATAAAERDDIARARRDALRTQQGPRITPQGRRWTRGS